MSGPVHPPQARRSRGGRIALIVWLAVFLLVAGATAWSAISYAGQPEDQRVPSGGGDVLVSEPGEYAVYSETTNGTTGSPATVRSLTAPSGASVPVTRPGFSENYTSGTRVGSRVGTFTATETGSYRIVGDNRESTLGDQLVVSTRTVGSIFGVVGGAIATGALLVVGLVGGLVMLLAGRRRLPPQAAYPGPYGAYPPHHPGPYPSTRQSPGNQPHPATRQYPGYPATQRYPGSGPEPGPSYPVVPYPDAAGSGPPSDDPTISARRDGEPQEPGDRT
ncbi:hypothetical protein [Pseudonocardia endophytica]|uniref:Uncharacterized protein n=1 Tax=Pseudonocardia endophytica TaxID=401976 RepID=A0A4R1HJS4_PSEEN|nr:hypothetical protein [Pseudonocardia endophytica]TCK22587.1 hypothetical protein EV378_6594 [Pseudonocardia endophytica]